MCDGGLQRWTSPTGAGVNFLGRCCFRGDSSSQPAISRETQIQERTCSRTDLGFDMKKFLIAAAGLVAVSIAAPASAADLGASPATQAPPVVATIYDWSGFYLGT